VGPRRYGHEEKKYWGYHPVIEKDETTIERQDKIEVIGIRVSDVLI
jgi:hypothetical protein